MTINLVAATAGEPDAGWGKLTALVLTAAVFWAATRIHQRLTNTKHNPFPDPFPPPLPDPEGTPCNGVKPQVNSPVTPSGGPTGKGSREGVNKLDNFVGQRLNTTRPTHLIRAAKIRFGASESTIKRAIRRAHPRKDDQ